MNKYLISIIVILLLILIMSGLNIISSTPTGLLIAFPSINYLTNWFNSNNFIIVVSLIFMFLMFYYIFYYKETRGRK